MSQDTLENIAREEISHAGLTEDQIAVVRSQVLHELEDIASHGGWGILPEIDKGFGMGVDDEIHSEVEELIREAIDRVRNK